jgi:hypothetical protein
VVEEEARKQAERDAAKAATAEESTKPDPTPTSEQTGGVKLEPSPPEAKMDLDDMPVEEGHASINKQDSSRSDESERKDDPTTMQADDDDAVEY